MRLSAAGVVLREEFSNMWQPDPAYEHELYLNRLCHLENRCDGFQKLFLTLFAVMLAAVAAVCPYLLKNSGREAPYLLLGLGVLGGAIAVVWAGIIENLTLQRKATWNKLGALGQTYQEEIQGAMRESKRKWRLFRPLRWIAVARTARIEHRIIPLIVLLYYISIVLSYLVSRPAG
jgi:hypothetical protein